MLLIAAPVWFNVTFALLGLLTDPAVVSFMLSGLLIIGGVVLFGEAVAGAGVIAVATVVGVLAGLVQMLGLVRWAHVVP